MMMMMMMMTMMIDIKKNNKNSFQILAWYKTVLFYPFIFTVMATQETVVLQCILLCIQSPFLA